MRKGLKFLSVAAVALLFMSCGTTKKTTTTTPASTASMPPAGTSSPTFGGTSSPTAQRTGPRSFTSFFDARKVRSQKGLIVVHWQDDKYYFEIPNSLMGKDFLTVTRFVRMAAGATVYGGEQANENVLRFERGPENRVFLRTSLHIVSSPDSTRPIYQAVKNSNVDPIAAAFPIVAFNRDTSGVVIEVTDFFKGDNQVVSLSPSFKRSMNLSSLATDRSYIESIRSFQNNTEIRTVKTFNSTPVASFGPSPTTPQGQTLPGAQAAGAVTLEVNTSFIRLPDVAMKRRFYDPRVGYFADQITEFLDTTQRSKRETFIVRWKLEPKTEDIAKYKRGELVEPKKQIVYYVDPATPTKWKPHLIQGINDWQKAFEKAGFKNAIVGKEWPADSTMSLEGANYSAIRYLASEVPNAYGPNVHDPRSGEIFESHIGWYHNVMLLLQNWYFVQAAAIDPGARKMNFDDALMGELIRFVSAHEVGHTLGLRHNMGSSSKTPVEKLRDKNWVEQNGHTASIMDYARFNYVAQPEDNISRKGLFPRIGEYDEWAIEWGYRWTDKSEEEDRKESNKLIVERLSKNPRLWFGGEGSNNDPRAQTEDLGDNSMLASSYGVKNLQRIAKNLPEWTKEEADRYQNLAQMYGQVLGQFNRYSNHVVKNIGGVYETFRSVEENANVYEPTPKAIQKDAVSWLHRNLFDTPEWLLDNNILNKISEPVNNSVANVQSNVLSNVMSAARLARMLEQEYRFGARTYVVTELLNDLKRGIWSEIYNGRAVDMTRRNLQKIYVDRLIALLPSSVATTPVTMGGFTIMMGANTRNTDVPSVARGHLLELQSEIRSAIRRTNDRMTRYHLMDLDKRIEHSLNPQ